MKYDLISVSAALPVTPLSPHCLKLCHSNFPSGSYLHIFSDFFHLPFALLLPRPPRDLLFSPKQGKPLTLKRDCPALCTSAMAEVKPLSLFSSEMQSLPFSAWISEKQLMQHQSRLSQPYAWRSELIWKCDVMSQDYTVHPHTARKYLHLYSNIQYIYVAFSCCVSICSHCCADRLCPT